MANTGQGRKGDKGRILYFEPNPANNQSINVEDLSIAVELTSTRKNRTIISVSESDDTAVLQNTGNNTLSVRLNEPVNFIGGSKTSNGTSLTTNYTELNTDLDLAQNEDLEGLGITNIDINFNTGYAPLVKINFVDVRGGAVIGKGNKSKYRVFFDLPYPIFNLTVKGFYGKAVQYCLHMTKWNGNFNSKTGNFEIQAEFIGFTYALLTDILLGYMRAITETPIGKSKFCKVKSEFGETCIDGEAKSGASDRIITINELLQRVDALNDAVTKRKKEENNVNALRGVIIKKI